MLEAGITTYAAFVAASSIMTLTPGIDTAMSTRMVLFGGRPAGIAAAAAISLGVFTQSFAAAAGLALIFTAFPFVFYIVKYAGGCYLLYLGIKSLYESVIRITAEGNLPHISSREAFISTYISAILNPKVTLFIVTFYPQFIAASHLDSMQPYLILGATYSGEALIWYFIYAFLADKLVGRMGRRFGIIMTRITGVVLVLMSGMAFFS